MIRIVVPGQPIAKTRPRFAMRGTCPVVYSSQAKEERVWVREAVVQIQAQSDHIALPIQGPVAVECVFRMPRPKSHYNKSGIRPGAPMRHTQKPDIDNLLKFVMDCLNQCGVWGDDTNVVEVKMSKVWDDGQGRTDVQISRIGESKGNQ